jgi:hypothetical protein
MAHGGTNYAASKSSLSDVQLLTELGTQSVLAGDHTILNSALEAGLPHMVNLVLGQFPLRRFMSGANFRRVMSLH